MKKSSPNKLVIEIPGRPLPKPRMTRRDKWNPRPIVLKYYRFVADVQEAYYKICSSNSKYPKFKCAAIKIIFYYAGSLNMADLDNLIKGIKDALVAIDIFPDDTMQYVRKYDGIDVVPLCETCIHEGNCRAIKKCKEASTIVEIRELEEVELEEMRNEAYKRRT